jgi:FK506-binding protein 4/5
MNNQEKIKAAERKKEEGNLLFKSGKYLRAGKKYDKVAQHLISPIFHCLWSDLEILMYF